MVQCIAAFIEACYIARRNAISEPVLQRFRVCVNRFYDLRNIFIEAGVRMSISLPRQHAFVVHYYNLIKMYGAPNGLCSSITESKHIKAVKEPWRRSSRFRALVQMLVSILRMEKLAAIRRFFCQQGLLSGTVLEHVLASTAENREPASSGESSGYDDSSDGDDGGEEDEENTAVDRSRHGRQQHDVDQQAVQGDRASLDDHISDVVPASRIRKYPHILVSITLLKKFQNLGIHVV